MPRDLKCPFCHSIKGMELIGPLIRDNESVKPGQPAKRVEIKIYRCLTCGRDFSEGD